MQRQGIGEQICIDMMLLWHERLSSYCHVQVYRGRLRSTGEEVALKVQRPGIGEQICLDMVLLRRLMMAVDTTLPKLKLPIQVCPHCPFPPLQVLPTLSNIWRLVAWVPFP